MGTHLTISVAEINLTKHNEYIISRSQVLGFRKLKCAGKTMFSTLQTVVCLGNGRQGKKACSRSVHVIGHKTHIVRVSTEFSDVFLEKIIEFLELQWIQDDR
jgi:hypothetical protein